MNVNEQILDSFGIQNVLVKLKEELFELQDELATTNGLPNKAALVQMADVLNVITTIDVHFNGRISEYAERKMERTAERIQNCWYDDNGIGKMED